MHANHDVLKNGHIRKELQVLKGPGQPPLSDPVRGEVCNLLSFKKYAASGGGNYPRYDVEKCGFPRAVRSDYSLYEPLLDLQVQFPEGFYTTEILGKTHYVEDNRIAHGSFTVSWSLRDLKALITMSSRPLRRPLGIKTMTVTRINPKTVVS